jgi:hypothetical protein
MDPDSQTIADRLLDVVANIPSSQEPPAIDPRARALVIARKAARRAGAVSGALSLPVGPVGLLTVLPDLVMTWRIQAQMVADIAAAFGKSQMLTREQLIYCLFEHGSAQSLRDFVTRVGERIGVKVARRSAGRSAARFLPLVGAAGVAFYAYRDTLHVHRTAVALFEGEAVMADEFV